MGGGANDLVAYLRVNASDFVANITESRDSLDKFAKASVEAMNIVSSSIKPATQAAQDQARAVKASTAETHAAVDRSHKGMASSARALLGPLTVMTAIIGRKNPTIRNLSLILGLAAAANRRYQRSEEEAARAARQAAAASEQRAKAAAKEAASHGGKNGSRNAKADGRGLGDLASLLSRQALGALILYKVGLNDVSEASAKHLKSNSALMQGVSSLTGSFVNLVNTGLDIYSEGVKGSMMAVIQLTTGFNDLGDIVDWSAKQAAGWANWTSGALQHAQKDLREYALVAGSALAAFKSGGTINASEFYAEGIELQNRIEQQQVLAGKMQTQKRLHDAVTDAIADAGSAHKRAADAARIGALQTVEAYDEEEKKLRMTIAATDEKTRATKAFAKWASETATAIGKGKSALETHNSDQANKMIEEATKKLKAEQLGAHGAQLALAQELGFSAEKVTELKNLLDATDRLTIANRQREESERAIQQAQVNANDQINKLRDQIALAKGQIHEYDLAMQEAMRSGATAEQAREIGELTAELQKTKEAADLAKTGKKHLESKAAMLGGSEAAEIMLRGVNGAQKNGQEKLQQESNSIAKQTLAVMTDIKNRREITLIQGTIT